MKPDEVRNYEDLADAKWLHERWCPVATGLAYTEQTTAKMQMAELERIDPTTPEWQDKLERKLEEWFAHVLEGIGRRERREALAGYLRGLLLEGERWSGELDMVTDGEIRREHYIYYH